jgi:hypothetical protein
LKKRYVLEAQHTDLGLWKIGYKRISTLKKRYVLEAQHIDLGLWKIGYKRISTIQIITLTATGSSTLR